MAINYIEAKPWEQPAYIDKIIEFVKKEKEYFIVLANLLHLYDTPDTDSAEKEERIQDLDDLIQTKGLDVIRTDEEITEFKAVIEDLYEEKPFPLSQTRGTILEAIVLTFGPRSITSPVNLLRYNEPQIYDNTSLIGGNNCVIDAVFHDDRETSTHIAEYIECKASIDSLIKLRYFPRASKKARKKWSYIKSVYAYLSTNYFTPSIFIACYNYDVTDYQDKLNQNGLGHIIILNDEEVYNMIS
ncbi:hypothetical protein [Neobacillus drentensis]|uniref:hypothetical protein n=1 Tax=Neobacillus drentensis TaxID=220684 RepID=UPI003000A75F